MIFDTTPVPVPVGDCRCPGAPHGDGDVVFLAPFLSAPGGMAAQGAIADAGLDSVHLQELLWRVYRDHGIVGWNLLDESGDTLELTVDNKTAALPYGRGGQLVADKADELYSEDVLRPFLARLAELQKTAAKKQPAGPKPLSAAGSTTTSSPATSPTRSSTSRQRRRS